MCSDWLQSLQDEAPEFWNYSTESGMCWEEKESKTYFNVQYKFSKHNNEEEEGYIDKQKNENRASITNNNLSIDDDASESTVSSGGSFQTPLSTSASASSENTTEEANIVPATVDAEELAGVTEKAWI